jgi:hypothetical protein
MKLHVFVAFAVGACIVAVACSSSTPAPAQSDANCQQSHGEVLVDDGGLVCCYATDAGPVCLTCMGNFCQ